MEEEQEPSSSDQDTESETGRPADHTPAVMFIPTLLLLAGTIGIGVWFGFGDLVATAAHRFADGVGYRAAVFGGPPPLGAASSSSPEWYDWLYGTGAVLLALAVAAVGLWGRRIKAATLLAVATTVMRPVKAVHTGRVGDYTAALVLGVALLGGLLTVTLR